MAYTYKHGDRPIEGITIQRAVGRGGFGEVYYALTDSGKQVALKYLRDNPDIELRGISHVLNLKSPHLITIYDIRHNAEGEPFVIMEYVSGPSLRDLLIAEPAGLGPQKAAFFLSGIAQGLDYLHQRGIVHRDLKPGNIFYDDGYVKIGDYGLSKHISVSAHSGNTISVGTVHYMAPEIGSGTYTRSIDIYALGVMLYEMLTGRLPFTGSSMGEVLMRHLSEQPDVSGIPEPFATVIARALRKDPSERYQDVHEMVEAVTSAAEVSESLASFDATVLARAPRVRQAPADQTRTAGSPPRPPLDAREAGAAPDLPPIPPIPPVPDSKAASQGRRIRRRGRKQQGEAPHSLEPQLVPVRPVVRRRWQQLFIALVVLFAAAGGLGIAYNNGVVFASALLYLLGGALGTLLAYKLGGNRDARDYSFYDRLLYTACGFVFMLPGFAAARLIGPLGFHRLIIALAGTLLVFNWTQRIAAGRRQDIRGWTIFWHGLAGAVLATMIGADQCAHAGAVLAAVLLILVQSLAAFWPLSAMIPATHSPQPHKRRHAWQRVEGACQRVSTTLDHASERIDEVAKRIDEKLEGRPGRAAKAHSAEAAQTADQPPAPAAGPQPAAPPPAATAFQPSFVGRTANAGLSFLAKLLLLAGLTAAFLFSAELVDLQPEQAGGLRVLLGGGQVLIEDHGRPEINMHIPPAAVYVPLLLGTILLVVARRQDGAAHFLRGFFGCLLAGLAAILATGPAAPELELFLDGRWDTLRVGDQLREVIAVFALLALAFLLLFWPRPVPRGQRPIVI